MHDGARREPCRRELLIPCAPMCLQAHVGTRNQYGAPDRQKNGRQAAGCGAA